MKTFTPTFEIAQETGINGRRSIKAILHEIHPDTDHYQHNGISWLEEYVRNNMSTVVGMSITAEFLSEERSTPYGHGLTGATDGMPIFEDATMIGHFDSVSIEDIDFDGVTKKCLVAQGTLDEMRYPNFIKWLVDEMSESTAKGSVEISGKKENDGQIIYNGGWKEIGRVPESFDYTGYAILSVPPADDAAVVMELNNKNNKREVNMEDKVMEAMQTFVAEISSKWDEFWAKVAQKDAEISQLNADIVAKNAEIAQKEAEIAQLKADYDAMEARAIAAEAGISEANSKIEAMENEVIKSELNSAIAGYSEEQREYAKSEIEAFMSAPVRSEINNIVGKICTGIVANMKITTETNSQNSEIDIFGMVDSESDDSETSVF